MPEDGVAGGKANGRVGRHGLGEIPGLVVDHRVQVAQAGVAQRREQRLGQRQQRGGMEVQGAAAGACDGLTGGPMGERRQGEDV